ncbi:MAG: tol-pal system protein YbgF [Ectothiorhodospira sp.]
MPRAHWLLPLLLPAVLALPAHAQNTDDGEEGGLEERVARMERILDNADLMDLFNQLQALEAEVRALRGENETLRHELERLKTRQRELYLDVDRRLEAALEQGGGDDQGDGDPAIAPLPEADPDGGSPETPSGQDRSDYQAAFERLRAGDFREAIQSFSDFLEAYPDSPLAANAQYWLAEGYYVTGDFERALEAFEAVSKDYPESGKVPDARLKRGYSLFELERWDEAREVLESVREEHPDTTVARLAEQRLRMLEERGD